MCLHTLLYPPFPLSLALPPLHGTRDSIIGSRWVKAPGWIDRGAVRGPLSGKLDSCQFCVYEIAFPHVIVTQAYSPVNPYTLCLENHCQNSPGSTWYVKPDSPGLHCKSPQPLPFPDWPPFLITASGHHIQQPTNYSLSLRNHIEREVERKEKHILAPWVPPNDFMRSLLDLCRPMLIFLGSEALT